MDNPMYKRQVPDMDPVHTQIDFNKTRLAVDDLKPVVETPFQKFQYKLRRMIESIIFRLIIAVLFLADIIIIIITVTKGFQKKSTTVLDWVSLCLSIIFMMDIFIRITAQGREFFQKKLEILDLLVISVGLIVNIVLVALEAQLRNGHILKFIIVPRIFRVFNLIRTLRILGHREHFKIANRHLVGQNKRRFVGNGYDLDLCYVTKQIIAMSFPSKGKDAFFRNDISDVGHFLDEFHREHYKVYNLCSERCYETDYFHRVERVLINDHNVPRLSDTIRLANSVTEWFQESSDNVIAIHCKGGKGRTGTMIAVALLKTGVCKTASEALQFFAEARTDLRHGKTFQGVETPSQTRYVGYYEKILHNYNNEMPPPQLLRLKSITITSIASIGNGDGSDLWFTVSNYDEVFGKFAFQEKAENYNICKIEHNVANDDIIISDINLQVLKGDVKFMFFSTNKRVPKNYDACAFYFWLNTSFIEQNSLLLTREELDNPHKSKTWHIFKENFSVRLQFDIGE